MNYWNIKTYKDWNYSSCKDFSTGYEEEYEWLNSIKKERFLESSEDEKRNLVSKIFSIYRGKNIYPIFYFSDIGIHNEILRCAGRDVEIKNKVMDFRYTQGNTLLKFLFPNFQTAYSGVKDNKNYINAFDKFYNDEMLTDIISFQLKYDSPIPLRLLNTSGLYRDRTPTNFSPMRAKAIFEKYTPVNGRAYDFSCGYGGRMLGALSSKKNIFYEGVDPLTETYDNLNILGDFISDSMNRKRCHLITKVGSEDYSPDRESIDFAFSSPPYYNLDRYGDEETQCYNRYRNVEDWFYGYVEKTIENIYKSLKSNGMYAVNIADFNISRGSVFNFVYKWIEISERIGFEHVETIGMKLSNRGGNKKSSITGGSNRKEEKIYVFKKTISRTRQSILPLFIRKKIDDYKNQIEFANSIRKEIEDWASESKFENIEKEIEKPLG